MDSKRIYTKINYKVKNKMDNILFCSCGRRATLLKDFRKSMNGCGNIVATDLSPVAPALFMADKTYLVPRISAPEYFDKVLEICDKEDVKAITTLIDPEIEILSKHREELLAKGVLLFVLLIGLLDFASTSMRCLSTLAARECVQFLPITRLKD